MPNVEEFSDIILLRGATVKGVTFEDVTLGLTPDGLSITKGNSLIFSTKLQDIKKVYPEQEKKMLRKKFKVLIEVASGEVVELLLSPQQSPDFLVNLILKRRDDAKALEECAGRVSELLGQGKPIAATLSYDADWLAESRRVKGVLSSEDISRKALIYLPFVRVKLYGPPHVTPKTVLLRLAYPHYLVSEIVHRGINDGRAAVALFKILMPEIFIPGPCQLTELKPAEGSLIVPPNSTPEEAYKTLSEAFPQIYNNIREMAVKTAENIRRAKLAATSLSESMMIKGSTDPREYYGLGNLEAYYSSRFFKEPVERAEYDFMIFLPFLFVEYKKGDKRRYALFDWKGLNMLDEVLGYVEYLDIDGIKRRVNVFGEGLEELLARGMYRDTPYSFEELMKSLISSNKVDYAEAIYRLAATYFPKDVLQGHDFDYFLSKYRPAEAAKAGEKDPWSVLGLQPGASKEVIRAVYRALIEQYDLSKLPEGTSEAVKELIRKRLQEVEEAYRALMGPEGKADSSQS